MTIKAITSKITKLGGTYTITIDKIGREELSGILNDHDIEFTEGDTFYTSRSITKRDYYDAGSDYNPSGYTFHNRVKELEYVLQYA